MNFPLATTLFLKCLLVVLFACGSGDKRSDELLKVAARLHNEAVSKAGELEAKLNKAGIAPDSIEIFKQALSEWKANLIEVPGNDHHDHDHNHGHDHHHHHKHDVELSPSEMLSIQKVLLHQIDSLLIRFRESSREVDLNEGE